ncbi:MAG: methionyl-tRNA formyltransferase [Thermodesulfovibrionia bacterium]
MRLIFFGTPEFAIPSLRSILDSGIEVIAVITQTDKQKGRGRRFLPPPVKIEAMAHGLFIIQPASVKDKGFIDRLKALNPDMIIVVAYGKILPSEIIHIPRMGCINLHASLLPKYRGAAPINWAIINGDKVTGVTTMLMDEGMDTGPILLQQRVEIRDDDTAGSLSERLAMEGAMLLIKTIEMVEKGDIRPIPQSGEPSYAPPLKKSDGLIDWSRPARMIYDFIRGVTPWPGAYTFLEGERIIITKVMPMDGEGRGGFIEEVTKDRLIVGTGNGLLSILELKPEGRSVMDIKSFLQGRGAREGMRFSC